MKRIIALVLIGLALAIIAGTQILRATMEKGQTESIAEFNPDFAPDRLLVKFRDGLSQSFAENIATGLGAVAVQKIHEQGLFLVKLEKGKELDAVKEVFAQNPSVEFVEPDYVVYAGTRTPNDPDFSKQWGFHNTGQIVNGISGTADADIDAPEAWDKTTGSNVVIIAIIDAGVAWDHPDLQANIWRNSRESLDGVDNDGNGYVDDIRGWDFFDDDNNPYDYAGHGTHVAGIAAAVGNNGIGITGVNWSAQIMPVRFLGVTGSGLISDAILAMNYAVRNGAKVINASYGTTQFSASERLAIESARNAGVLFIAAAGNSGTSNESQHHYPSDHDLDNIVSVAATTQTDALASFSNYGSISVDVGAPGTNIYSTLNITPTPLFFDNVEAGDGGWDKQSPWDITTSLSFSPTRSWTDSPSGNYANGVNTSLILKNAVNLANYQGAKLSFKLRMITESRYDFLWIEASRNKSTWQTLSQLSGSTGGQWFDWEEDLSAFSGDSVYVRFRLTSDGSSTFDGAYIDDVRITAFPPGPYTYRGTEYTYFSGTSMAAPHVAGLAALILSRTPTLTYSQVRARIFETVDPLSSLAGRVATGGRINARTATLNPPDIATSIAPNPLNFTRNFGDSTTATITIRNLGERDLTFQIGAVDSLPAATSSSQAEKREALHNLVANLHARAEYKLVEVSGQTADHESQELKRSSFSPEDVVAIGFARETTSSFNVALLVADNSSSNTNDVRSKLLATGNFASVTVINVAAVTPTLAELSVFDAVMVWSNAGYQAPQTLGNNLADYVDRGGNVVTAMFETGGFPAYTLTGRWESGQYYVISRSSSRTGAASLGTIFQPGHPIMNNVSTFSGGTSSFRPSTTVLTSGATLIASWSDGVPLVAIKTIQGRRRADLGFYPPSSSVSLNFWSATTDGAKLMANALLWVAGTATPEWLFFDRASGTITPNASVTIQVKIRTANLIPGRNYYKNIRLTSNDPDNPLVRIPAALRVNPEPYFVAFDQTSSRAEGHGKDVVTHALRLRNYGSNGDSYNLSAIGNRWKTEFFDSTGATRITRTPNIAAGGNLKILARVTVDSTVLSGRQDTVRVTAASVGNSARSSAVKLTTASLGPRGLPPWLDTFPNPTLDPSQFTYNNGPAEINILAANEPSLPYSLNLDGIAGNFGDEVRTQAINLAGMSGILLRYYYQAGGGGEAPDSGDSLKVDYQNAAGSWINLAGHNGTGISASTFTLQELTLPAGAYHINFRLRFRLTRSSGAGQDDWFVDDVFIVFPSPLAVSPTGFDVLVTPGDSVNQILTLSNPTAPGSSAEVRFSITAVGAPWLSFIPVSGTLVSSASQNVTVKFNGRNLRADTLLRANIIVNSNGVPPVLTIPATLRTSATQLCTKPTHFTFTEKTGGSYAIVIDNATLNGVRLKHCDEIGVFTPGGLGVGAVAWNDTLPLGFSVWQDNPQTPAVDGYRAGEQMFFRVWDSAARAEYQANPAYSVGNGNFGFGSLARLSLNATRQATQVITLRQGWNWISFNVEPAQLRVDSVFANVAGLEILQNCAGQFYIPGVINQIGNINVLTGYIAYMNRSNTVTVRGRKVPVNTPIPLSAGWNCIPYFPDIPLPPQVALRSIIDNLDIVQNDSGRFMIPSLVDNILFMRAGRGYKAHLKAADTLIYPSGSLPLAKGSTTSLAVSSAPTKHFKPVQMTDVSYSIVITSVNIDGREAKPGDEIAIFTSKGQCAGAGVWNESGVLAFAAWQDDERTREIDGYLPGEPIHFRGWNQSTNTEIILTPAFERGNGAFGQGEYALVKLSAQTLPTSFALREAYPNPFNPATTIAYDLPHDTHITLKIFDVMGREVRTLVDEMKPAGSHQLVWDGRNAHGDFITTGVYLYQMKTPGFVRTRRLLFLK